MISVNSCSDSRQCHGHGKTRLGIAHRAAAAMRLRHQLAQVQAQTDAAGVAGNLIVQCLARLASERGTGFDALGLSGTTLAKIVALRLAGDISANGAEKLVELALTGGDPRELAQREGLIQVSDTGQLKAWCDEVIAEHGPIVQQIREGKAAAVGRLIGEVMKKSGGAADAKAVREILLRRIGA